MIYLVGLLAGFLNGMFASGAGQIIVFYLIYVLCINTVKSRSTSVALMTIGASISIFKYMKMVDVDIVQIIIVAGVSLACGIFGPMILKKMNANIVNLTSGIIIVTLGVIKLFMR